MATVQARKIITLTGRLATPIVVSNPFFKKGGCWVRIVSNLETEKRGILTTVGKLVKGERRAPTILRGYRGFVKVSCVDSSEMRARSKIERFLSEGFLGRYASEGFGKVQWLDCQIADFKPSFLPKNPDALPFTERYCPICNSMVKVCYWSSFIQGSYARFYRCTICKHLWRGKKFKLRKGLGGNYPEELQRLILALLLHDFVHTEKHQSKIYEQVTIEDEEIRETCLYHHATENNSNNDLLATLQYYDGLASGIAQKKPIKSYLRYDSEEGKIDFKELVRRIEERQQCTYKLYQFIYHSQELERTVKSMDYEGSLRNHLLLMVNLAIDDWRDGRLIITTKGKLKITEKKKVLSSATEGEEVALSAMDAEMYPFPTMNNAESESPSNSRTEEAWNIGGEKPIRKSR